ncbi:MAG: hypothetical protein ACHREM_13455 [Polyangiales bacterium]
MLNYDRSLWRLFPAREVAMFCGACTAFLALVSRGSTAMPGGGGSSARGGAIPVLPSGAQRLTVSHATYTLDRSASLALHDEAIWSRLAGALCGGEDLYLSLIWLSFGSSGGNTSQLVDALTKTRADVREGLKCGRRIAERIGASGATDVQWSDASGASHGVELLPGGGLRDDDLMRGPGWGRAALSADAFFVCRNTSGICVGGQTGLAVFPDAMWVGALDELRVYEHATDGVAPSSDGVLSALVDFGVWSAQLGETNLARPPDACGFERIGRAARTNDAEKTRAPDASGWGCTLDSDGLRARFVVYDKQGSTARLETFLSVWQRAATERRNELWASSESRDDLAVTTEAISALALRAVASAKVVDKAPLYWIDFEASASSAERADLSLFARVLEPADTAARAILRAIEADKDPNAADLATIGGDTLVRSLEKAKKPAGGGAL